MTSHSSSIILGSRSPRRLELLGQIVPPERIAVVPPRSSDEAGFDDIADWIGIVRRLSEIASAKCDDVIGQLETRSSCACVITADTMIVGTSADGSLQVLGQPPEIENWRETVRHWFREFYFGKPHYAATAVCIATPVGKRAERVVRTEVTFRADGERWLEWYLQTGEPRGKAGGYAIQDAGSLFVERIDGSLSNVVGLPLADVFEMLDELKVDTLPGERPASGTRQ